MQATRHQACSDATFYWANKKFSSSVTRLLTAGDLDAVVAGLMTPLCIYALYDMLDTSRRH
jgi:hypothetical protein